MHGSTNDIQEQQKSLITHSSEEFNGVCSRIFTTKTSKLTSMLILIILYFLAELIVGHVTSSLTLVADSFHMLSDGLSLIVGLVAVRMSKRKASHALKTWPSKQRYFNTFGWVRFEVVGALINATFLLAICISILIEAVEKFVSPQLISKPLLVLAVGGGGLLINLFGLVLFGAHSHGHDHGDDNGRNHDHGHHGRKYSVSITAKSNGSVQKSTDSELGKSKEMSSEDQLNMKAVFLHVLGDALGSLIVMISALVVYFVPHSNKKAQPGKYMKNCSALPVNSTELQLNDWIVYLDPFMSIVLVVIMFGTTVPLFKKSSLILLQTVPKRIHLDSIKKKIETIEGVLEIHDFHIWQLAGDTVVATVHVQCLDSKTYNRIATEMKSRLHHEGIHSLTIQPEFKDSPTKHCSIRCPSNSCRTKLCCDLPSEPVQRKVAKTSTTSLNQILHSNQDQTKGSDNLVNSFVDVAAPNGPLSPDVKYNLNSADNGASVLPAENASGVQQTTNSPASILASDDVPETVL